MSSTRPCVPLRRRWQRSARSPFPTRSSPCSFRSQQPRVTARRKFLMTTTVSISQMGVADIAHAVASHELTPSEVLEAVFERIDATEGKIQAWSQLERDVARAEAATLTAEIKAGKPRGPLHGVPVA